MGHQGVRGYGTYCHIRNANDVFKNIDQWQRTISGKEVKVKFHDKEGVRTLSELKENLCGDYFKRYFEKLAVNGPVVLPQIPSGVNKIVDTMERWCNDTNDSPDLKGLVVHSLNVSEYFGKFFYDELEKETVRKDLDIKDFPITPIIIVYNPQESVILLIRKSENENLRKEIEFCSHDMKMFMLLFGSEVNQSRVKTISLLVSNEIENEYLKCEGCKNCIVSLETLQSYRLFQALWDNLAENFNVTNTDDIDEIKVIAASAKLIGCLAAAPYFEDLPTFTEVPNEQMKHVLVLLTPAQKRILYCGDKHLIVQGPYGSGKSILARKKLHLLSNKLKESKKEEQVHFICFDSQSALLSEVGRSPNIIAHVNKAGEKLSEIIRYILKVANSESVNLIVDEFDGENLDREEAAALNCFFEDKFLKKVVFLVPQSMEKERHISIEEKEEKEENNMFHLLKTMKQVNLSLVMRNSVAINNLIKVTQNFLKQQETIYRHPSEDDASRGSSSLNKKPAALVVSASNSKSKEGIKIKSTESSKKIAGQIKNEKQQSISEPGLSDVPIEKDVVTKKFVDKSTEKSAVAASNSNSKETLQIKLSESSKKIASHVKHEKQQSITEPRLSDVPIEKDNVTNEFVHKSTEKWAVSASKSNAKALRKIKSSESSKKIANQVKHEKQIRKSRLSDVHPGSSNVVTKKIVDKSVYNSREDTVETMNPVVARSSDSNNQEQHAVGNFGLDEVFSLAGSPRASKDDVNRIVNRFRYIASKGIGHNVNSSCPKLFEVDFDNTNKGPYEKLFALNCIFRKLNIWNSNSNNKHVILHFDTSTSEIPKLLTPIIECREISNKVTNNYKDFKYNNKSILVCNFRVFRGLEHSNVTLTIDQDIYSVQHYLVEAMARCTNNLAIVVLEKSVAISRIISQWENGLNGQQLIDQWKVQICTEGDKESDYDVDKKLHLITVNESSKSHEEMRKKFDQNKEQHRASNVTRIAEEFLQRR